MIRAVSLTLAAAFCVAAAAPESRLEQFFRLRKEAGAAAQANDLTKAEDLLEQALALYRTSPGSLIRLARVETAAGKPAEAIAHLRAFAQMGLVWDIAGDKAFAPLADHPEFASVAARIAANAQPVGTSTIAATLPMADQIYEGLARQGDGWLVSSVTQRMIYRVDADGAVTPFLKADSHTGGLFGIAVDGQTIWAAEASGPDVPKSGKEARTALLRIDGRTGAILARYAVDDASGPVQLGDVVVAHDGTVYASASVGQAIYRLRPGATALDVALTSNELGSPQGLVVCDGQNALLIADYSTGLHRLDLKSGMLEMLGGRHVPLAGTDGLFKVSYDYRMRNATPHPITVAATQNGINPTRVILLRISPDCRAIEGVRTIASNEEGLADLTLGAAMPGGVAVISRSGWAVYGPDARPSPDTTTEPPRIVTYPFPKD